MSRAVRLAALAAALAPVSLASAAPRQESPLTVHVAEFVQAGYGGAPGGMSVRVQWTLHRTVRGVRVSILGPSTRRFLLWQYPSRDLTPRDYGVTLPVHRFPGFFRPGAYTFRFSTVADGVPFTKNHPATLRPGPEGLLRAAWISLTRNGRPLRNRCPRAVREGNKCLHDFVYTITGENSRLWAHFRFWAAPAARSVHFAWSGPRAFRWSVRRPVRQNRVSTFMAVPGGRLVPGRYRCEIRAGGVLLKALVVRVR